MTAGGAADWLRRTALVAAYVALAVGASALPACGGDAATPSAAGAGGGATGAGGGPATTSGGGGGGASPCLAGNVLEASGSCRPIGILGCDARFVGADGVCRPSLAACPAGQIPDFTKGCVPVGVPSCAPIFVEADGLCHVASSKCAPGEIGLPQLGCVPLDGADGCGVGTWGSVAPMSLDQYVDQSYAGGSSDGSRAKPFTTVAAALAAAADGGRVVVAAGTYVEAIQLARPIEVRGVCASKVTLAGAELFDQLLTVVYVTAAGVTVRQLTLAGPGLGVHVFGAAAAATLDGVHVEYAHDAGVYVEGGASVTVTKSAIDDTDSNAGLYGFGASVFGGSHATFQDSVIRRSGYTGVLVQDAATTVDVADTLIEGTLLVPGAMDSGIGIVSTTGGAVSVDASAIVANHAVGANAQDGGTLTVKNSVVEGTLPADSQSYGYGLEVIDNGTLEVTSCAILKNGALGVQSAGTNALFTMTGTLVADTVAEASTKIFGRGLSIAEGVNAHVTSCTFARNLEAGVAVGSAGTEATLSGILVEATSPNEAAGEFGVGIVAADGGTLHLSGSAISGAEVAGLLVVGAKVDVSNGLITSIQSGKFTLTDGTKYDGIGDGVTVTEGGPVTLKDTLVEDCVRAGILFASSAGAVDSCDATRCALGFVSDGTPTPTLATNSFAGNGQAMSTQHLAVPEAPPPPPK